jgi:uncharacterized protein (TIGR03435 family)
VNYQRLLVSSLTLCCVGWAQSFDVVSIKPYQSTERPYFRFDRLPGDHEIRATTTLGALIRMIYRTTSDYIVKPTKDAYWIDQDWWELDAKSEQSFIEPGAMLQNLLADRFKLQVETEQKLETVYVLTVDHAGLKISKNEDAPRSELSFGVTRDEGFVLRATAVTMAQLVFSRPFWALGDPIVDSTGLLDRYDVHWVLGSVASSLVQDPFEPSAIIETCRRQLGLNLERTKGRVSVIKIVRVEKPTAN